MNNRKLISLAELKEMIAADNLLQVTAHSVGIGSGYYLTIDDRSGEDAPSLVLATYLSDNVRVFKRADAVISELNKLGLEMVVFRFN